MSRSRWWSALLVVVATAVAYHAALDGPFVFDDRAAIVGNEDLDVLWPPWAAADTSLRKLSYFCLALNRAIGGVQPWSYHLLNVVLHALTGLVLLALMRRAAVLPSMGFSERDANGVATAVALLWVVHPLNTQAVTYVVQRAEVMAGLGVVCTLYAFVRAVESGADRAHRGWLAVSVLASYAALVSKESAATAPFVVFLFDVVFVAGAFGGALRRRALYYSLLILPVVAAPVVLYIATDGDPGVLRPSANSPPALTYFGAQGAVILEYLGLVVWPVGLNFDHGWNPAEHGTWMLVGFVVVALTAIVTAEGVRRRARCAWLAAAFFLLLAPSSSLLPLADLKVEHRMYLALAPCLVAIVLGGRTLLRQFVADGERRDVLAWGLVGTAAIVLIGLSVVRTSVYRTRIALWSDVAAKSPLNPRAHFNLGLAWLERGGAEDMDRALVHFVRATELLSTHDKAHTNAGGILYRRGEHAAAAEHYRAVIRAGRRDFEAWNHLGMALLEAREHAEAALALERAIEAAPAPSAELALLHNHLGVCHARDRDWPRAIVEFRRALELDPGLTEARSNMARAVRDGARGDTDDRR